MEKKDHLSELMSVTMEHVRAMVTPTQSLAPLFKQMELP